MAWDLREGVYDKSLRQGVYDKSATEMIDIAQVLITQFPELDVSIKLAAVYQLLASEPRPRVPPSSRQDQDQADKEILNIESEAVQERQKQVRIATLEAKSSKGTFKQQVVAARGEWPTALTLSLNSSHRALIVSADLLHEDNMPWSIKSKCECTCKRSDALAKMLELSSSLCDHVDFQFAFDGQFDITDYVGVDKSKNKSKHRYKAGYTSELWLIYRKRQDCSTRDVFGSNSNKEIGYMFLPASRSRISCQPRSVT